MFSKLRPRSVYDVFALLALVVAVGGTGAYAADTIRSADIVDGEVKSADVANQDLTGGDIKDNSISSFDVASLVGDDVVDETLTGSDIKNFTLGNGDFLDQSVDARVVTNNSLLSSDLHTDSVGSDEVTNDSLTGTDINESTLNLSPVSTATFAGSGNVSVSSGLTKVASKNLPAGSWVVFATVTFGFMSTASGIRSVDCELHNGTGFIGGTGDRRSLTNSQFLRRSLSMNGGAQVPPGGGEVSVWCSSQGDFVEGSQMLMLRIGGFS